MQPAPPDKGKALQMPNQENFIDYDNLSEC